MRVRLLLVALFVLTVTGCASEQVNPRSADVARAGGDPFDVLETRWEGYWEWNTWSRGRGKEDLTLVITRVTGTGSSREVSGRMMMAIAPKNAPVSGTAELSGDTIVVRMSTSTGHRVTLILRGDLLLGEGITAPGPASLHEPHKVLLKMVARQNRDAIFQQSRGALLATLPPERQIPDMESLEGLWRRPDRKAGVIGLALLSIFGDGRAILSFDGRNYFLETRVDGGKILWTYESRSGTITLYEGNGKRVLRMASGDSMVADYVFDGP